MRSSLTAQRVYAAPCRGPTSAVSRQAYARNRFKAAVPVASSTIGRNWTATSKSATARREASSKAAPRAAERPAPASNTAAAPARWPWRGRAQRRPDAPVRLGLGGGRGKERKAAGAGQTNAKRWNIERRREYRLDFAPERKRLVARADPSQRIANSSPPILAAQPRPSIALASRSATWPKYGLRPDARERH